MEIRTLGLPHHRYCEPFAAAAASAHLRVVRESPSIVSRALEAGDFAAGFVSPLDYARNASEYRIVPGAGVASIEGNGVLTIRFRSGARSIRTLAVPAIAASDIVLARLLLSEKFGLKPSIVPVAGPVEAMLAKADAALIAPTVQLPEQTEEEGLDLVEEWVLATGLPYVHGIIATREGELQPPEIDALAAVAPSATLDPSIDSNEISPVPFFTYGLSGNTLDGLKEFLQYAYFHGILPDVPEIKFLGEE